MPPFPKKWFKVPPLGHRNFGVPQYRGIFYPRLLFDTRDSQIAQGVRCGRLANVATLHKNSPMSLLWTSEILDFRIATLSELA